MTKPLCLVVPTFQRVDGLIRAIESIYGQTHGEPFDLLMVDNDPAGSAADAAKDLIAKAPAHISARYIHEPKAGVANARNAAMAATDCPMIAFLDDDQSAPPEWLSRLLANYEAFPAPVTFGPVDTALPDGITRHRVYLADFFDRKLDAPSGYIDDWYGCGNALLDRDLLPKMEPLFDVTMNDTGGEDDILFLKNREAGGKFAWCADAPVFEHVPASRATLDYTLKRAFSYGQGPVTMALRQTPANYPKAALWVAVGFAKMCLNAVIYAGAFIIRHPNRAEYLDRAARGAGKVFWGRQLRFYGPTRLKKQEV